ncbi:hypothetical protein QF000_006668 [Paraburkholderia atlantica]|uniref:hypothetical protein n=1 Tax=Paraburkholderia atlantica TaxID=2654982 RepID=UPI003D206EDE
MSERTEYLATSEVAKLLKIKGVTIHQRLWKHGSLYGLVPERALNGRLRFPANAVRDLQRALLLTTPEGSEVA